MGGVGGGSMRCCLWRARFVGFGTKEMALAMALNLAVSQICSVLDIFLSPLIADSTGVALALRFDALVCALKSVTSIFQST